MCDVEACDRVMTDDLLSRIASLPSSLLVDPAAAAPPRARAAREQSDPERMSCVPPAPPQPPSLQALAFRERGLSVAVPILILSPVCVCVLSPFTHSLSRMESGNGEVYHGSAID
jgi:hypothetical protein